MQCDTLVFGMVNQGAWSVESICNYLKTEKINDCTIKEMKDDVLFVFSYYE